MKNELFTNTSDVSGKKVMQNEKRRGGGGEKMYGIDDVNQPFSRCLHQQYKMDFRFLAGLL